MKKIVVSMMVLLFAGFIACSSDDSSKSLSSEQAFTIFSNAMSTAMDSSDAAVDDAMSVPSGSMMNIAPGEPVMATDGYTMNWTNPEGTIHVTGDLSYTDSPVNYDYTATITFSNYSCEDGSIINGSSTDDFEGDDTSFSAHIFGDMDVTYQGEGYDFSWDFTMACNESGCTYGGNFTIGGVTYPLEEMEME